MGSHAATEWDEVWAEFDARAGGPPMPGPQPLPWYLDPGYGAEPLPPPPVNHARGPLLTIMTVALVMLSAMLNIEFVPERPVQPGAPGLADLAPPRPAPAGLVVSIGGRAEAAQAPMDEPPPSTLLVLAPPAWVATMVPGAATAPAEEAAAQRRAIRATTGAAAREPAPAARPRERAAGAPRDGRQKVAQAARPAPRQAAAQPQCAPLLAALPAQGDARLVARQPASRSQAAAAIGPGPYLLGS